ncbi:hypothetical protein GCM10027275_15460 [Rhabdobacter roseus]|uniref:Membrane-bound ClpP family serine protease n=1 Tax=Rhabdobacter roseus TaxID=1655419 RepID=A0A840TH41_9BACT|nr:DUF3098 domain-containing protein [Rhabdobacter roseus]MBB5283466.1 membrane-bound ClpP family serine protease [Rhabdobacter roseus]
MQPNNPLPFGSANYRLMLVGIGIILLGFFIMSLDSEEFGFGVLGLTVGPIITIIGFIVEFWAILYKPSNQ